MQDICNVLEIEDLSREYPDLESQRAAKSYLQERFRDEFAKQTTAHWIGRLEEADLLCAPVRELPEVLEDPQTEANGIIVEFEHPVHGAMRVVGCPIHFSSSDCGLRMAPPRLGEHNEEILAELGKPAVAKAGA